MISTSLHLILTCTFPPQLYLDKYSTVTLTSVRSCKSTFNPFSFTSSYSSCGKHRTVILTLLRRHQLRVILLEAAFNVYSFTSWSLILWQTYYIRPHFSEVIPAYSDFYWSAFSAGILTSCVISSTANIIHPPSLQYSTR